MLVMEFFIGVSLLSLNLTPCLQLRKALGKSDHQFFREGERSLIRTLRLRALGLAEPSGRLLPLVDSNGQLLLTGDHTH
jgi:hypothetical protein